MVKQHYRIALFCAFFGEFPWYFPYFSKSCEFNPDVHFYIVSDSTPEIVLPNNITIIPSSFSEFKIKVQERLGFKIQIDRPYKLCDFKPCYGVIFSDIIEEGNYDFWGHCDIDVVFGRIRKFINDDLLANYDIISVRHEYTSGFFMLYRNELHINTLFRKSKDYIHVLGSPKSYCFDECSYHHRALIAGRSIESIQNHIDAMTFVIKREEKKGTLRACFELFALEGTPGSVVWANGSLCVENQIEALLYHIMQIKGRPTFNGLTPAKIPDIFEFTPHLVRFPKERFGLQTELPTLNTAIYLKEPLVQIIFGAYQKGLSGKFRACGAFA
ncbi:DUF6625 family protein [Sphingobacterium sp. R2]|uniref:DUF6625 family protein n=1 Tax=Sphingobacterium sp. R2 TaxID=3112958 RepID=UPI00345D41EB